MWKKWYEAARAWLTRERTKKLGWYGALALLLVLLGAGSSAYRNRRTAPEVDVPQAAPQVARQVVLDEHVGVALGVAHDSVAQRVGRRLLVGAQKP